MVAPSANWIDVHVGSRVRLRRRMLGLSQDQLGMVLGLTFPQVEKYEKGVDRLGAGLLQRLATILDVPPAFFFEGLPSVTGARSRAAPAHGPTILGAEATLDLVKAFMDISDAKMRRSIVALLEGIAP